LYELWQSFVAPFKEPNGAIARRVARKFLIARDAALP
jgi:hypothetical protein